MKSMYQVEALCREIQKEKILFRPNTNAEQTGQSLNAYDFAHVTGNWELG